MTAIVVVEDIPLSVTVQSSLVGRLHNVTFRVILDPSYTLGVNDTYFNISYGDGNNKTLLLSDIYNYLIGSGYEILHAYETQGNFTITSNVYTGHNNIALDEFSVFVWDELGVTLNESIKHVAVLETIFFEFVNPPSSGFVYTIDFGDGNVLKSGNAILFSEYTAINFSHSYTAPGVYNVMMFAENSFYTSTNNIEIIAQYPIPTNNMVVLPENPTLPFPGCTVIFTLNLQANFPSATNVTCKFDYGNGDSEEMFTDIVFGDPTEREYTYSAVGINDVVVMCSNLISSVTLNTTVTIVPFSIDTLVQQTPFQRYENVEVSLHLDPTFNLDLGKTKIAIDFADGSTPAEFSLKSIESDMMSGNGFSVLHQYVTQGNYTMQFKIYHKQNAVWLEPKVVYIWDPIYTTINSSIQYAMVDELVTFMFFNPPAAGFWYKLYHSDGAIQTSEEDVVYQLFTNPVLNRSYSGPGIYYLTMVAWNPFYYSTNKLTITVQYPIPSNITLIPIDDEIPIPGSDVVFTLEVHENTSLPTNVTCRFDFGEWIEDDVKTDLIYGAPIVKDIVYQQNGTKKVNFTCQNYVSSTTHLAEIRVRSFVLSDFTIHYRDIFSMNMTKIVDDHGNVEFYSKNQTVDFIVTLFQCSRFPPNITFQWDFDDGTLEDPYLLESLYHNHTYEKRGNYTIKIHMTSPDETFTRQCKLQIGVLQFFANMYMGVINKTEFHLTAVGIGSKADYVIDLDTGDNPIKKSKTNAAIVGHVYTEIREFFPFVIGTNATFYERVYLPRPVKVDYSIMGMNASFTNKSVLLPPGNVNITVFLPEFSTVETLLTCEINMGDDIDTQTYIEYHNISATTPYTFVYNYLTMGLHTVKVNCYNLIERFAENETFIDVYNPCFAERGIFDRHYSKCTTALRVYTSINIDIASRMPVKCVEKNPSYIWTIQRNVDCVDEEEDIPYNHYDHKPNGIFRFWKGTMEPGVYKVSLKVDLEDTWAYEYTFVEFERPPPHAEINGGFRKYVQRDEILLDAFSSSYNYDGGVGDNQNLTFEWGCFRYNESDMFGLNIEEIYTSRGGIDYFSNISFFLENSTTLYFEQNNLRDYEQDCGDALIPSPENSGIAKLRADTWDFNHYIVCVKVNLVKANSSFTCQLLSIVLGKSPTVEISCKVNCREKVATKSPLSVEGLCSDCSEFERKYQEFSWSLLKWNINTRKYEEVTNLEQYTTIGTNLSPFILEGGLLKEGDTYLLVTTLSLITREQPGQARRILKANYLPYGGSCVGDNYEGNATTTLFVINCKNWKDEGPRDTQSAGTDASEPLAYEYILIRPIDNDSDEYIPLFYAGERSASELLLPVGNEDFDYKMKIWVRVVDIYGDYTIDKSVEVRVIPDSSMTVTNKEDDSGFQNILHAYNETLPQLRASGNVIAVIRYVGAIASLLTKINTTAVNDTKMITEIKNMTRDFMEIFYNAVSDYKVIEEVMNAGDTNNVIQNVKACMKNADLIDDETMETAMMIINTLTSNMVLRSREIPYPTEDLPNINMTSEASLDIIEKAITSGIPTEMDDVYNELMLEEIEFDLKFKGIIKQDDNYTTAQAFIDAEYNRRIENRNTIRQLLGRANTTMNSMISAVENFLGIQGATALSDEPERIFERSNVRVTIEKTSWDGFLNRTDIDKVDMKISFDNTTNSTDQMELRTSVFEKIPYFHAVGAGRVTSKGVMINVVNGTSKQNVSMTVSIKNNGGAQFRQYQPEYIADDPENRLYYKFVVRDTDDATLLYLKPQDFDPNDYGTFPMYDVSLTSAENRFATEGVSKYSMDIRDWEGNDLGFRVFFPQNTLSVGEAYAVLKPADVAAIPYVPSGYRRKRSADNSTTSTGVFRPAEANFSLIIVTTGCKTYSEGENAWVSRGCEVSSLTTINETVCRCPEPQGQMFATTFYVPPNTIDFSGVWSKFDAKNAAVYGTIIALICVYLLLCLWARRQDKKDTLTWATHFLCDTDKYDNYFYLMTVYTGMNRAAGTDSSAHFVLGGEAQDSGVRVLSDGFSKGFETGSVKRYFLGTNGTLGDLIFLRVWHDNTGLGPKKSWFLKEIVLDDLQTNKRYVFVCDRWLAEDRDDGLVERDLTITEKDDLMKFQNVFSHHARINITDNHLWVSLVLRPHKSKFTRVQRLTCILALLFLTMISNAMFYRTDDQVDADTVTLGSMQFSLKNVYVSIIGMLIATPPIILVTMIFRNTKTKVDARLKPLEQRLAENEKERSEDKKRQFGYNDEDFYRSNDHLLPYWMTYVGWIITVLAILVPSFFLILYSMEWGKDKSEEWLLSFVLSFIESISVVDPIKVLAIAILMALLFRQSTYCPEKNIKVDEVASVAKFFNGGSSRLYRTFRMDVLSGNSPPSPGRMIRLKQRRQQEVAAQEALVEIVLYVIFCFVVYSIGYINQDERAFRLKDNIYQTLFESSKNKIGFDKVASYEAYMNWLRGTLFVNYFPEQDYNGAALDVRDKLFFSDLDNARIGPARLRQVRMKKDSCPYSSLNNGRYCVPDYEIEKEENGYFCIAWQPYNKSCDNNRFTYTANAWKFKTSEEIWGMTMVGDYGSYGGGGYILELDNGLTQSLLILDQLEAQKWIDRRTRAVFLEFTLYNANTNLFAYCVFLTEFTVLGGFTTWADIQSFRPYQHTGAMGAYAVICYLIYLIVLIVGTVKMVMKFKEIGCRVLIKPWLLVDVLCLIISYIGIAMWTLRYYYANQSMQIYYDNKETFINFQHVVVWNYIFTIIVGLLVFISTIRFLRILGYNKRMTQLSSVITGAAKDLLGFSLVFGIVFFAYVMLGHLIFGIHMREYRSIFTTFGSLANALIGKNSLNRMTQVVPEISMAYYFTYVFFVILTLMTMFAAILNQSISEVRLTVNSSPNVFGVVDVIKNSFMDVFGSLFVSSKDVKNQRSNNKKYLKRTSGTFDPPNILRLVRDTFDEDLIEEHPPPGPIPNAQEEAMLMIAATSSKQKKFAAVNNDFFKSVLGNTDADFYPKSYLNVNANDDSCEDRCDTNTPYLHYL